MDRLRDLLDMHSFETILEMDDGDNKEFSTVMIYDFITQWERRHQALEEALSNGDMSELHANAGWFKSWSTLGTNRNADWDRFQHWTKRQDVRDGVVVVSIPQEEAWHRLSKEIEQQRRRLQDIAEALNEFLIERGTPID